MSSGQLTPSLTPSHPFVTANDHTSLLNVVGWFLVVVMVLIVLVRLGTRWVKSRTFGLDDGAIILSTVFAIAQTTTVSLGVANGLGRSTGDETGSQLVAQQKAIYAFTILFIIGQFFAKLSVIIFVMAMSPDRTHKIWSWCFTAVTCVWMVTSVFGFAFQCDSPYPWKFIHHKCVDRVAFYTFVEVFNVLLDIGLALFPSFIIVGLQMLDTKRKAITIVFFMSRLCVVAAVVAQLVVIYSRTGDPFLSWTFAMLVMIIQTFGIVTACGPYLKPFLDSINSGMMGNDDIRRRHGSVGDGYYAGKEKRLKESKLTKKLNSLLASGRRDLAKSSQLDQESELGTIDHHQFPLNKTEVSSMSNTNQEEWEVGSQSSRTHIIRQTVSYRVTSETSE